MRRGVVSFVAMAVALAVAVPFSGAVGPPTNVQSMNVVASTHAAGARPDRLKITFRYVMQCGYPGPGPLVVTFPAAMKLPKRFAAGSVKLAGKAIAATRSGRKATVTIPPHKGVLCGVMAMGAVTLTFTQAAELGNPTQAGSYRFSATHAKLAFKTKLAIG